MSDPAPIAVVGAGPAGLIAAEILSAAGRRVTVYERMPSVARKFLMAGRGGLNLTHAEPADAFLARYGAARAHLEPMLAAYPPADLIAWCEGLGQPTFVGSSRRVFPRAMKASPLLRAWLERLRRQGVELVTGATWRGFDDAGRLRIDGAPPLTPQATLLALGGASWPRLGSDGSWHAVLAARGVAISPFKPANVGFAAGFSAAFVARFAGQPLKAVALRFADTSVPGEVLVTRYGIEGGPVYALTPALRTAIEHDGRATVHIDLRPGLTVAEIATRLSAGRPGASVSSRLRKSLKLAPIATNLLREAGPLPHEPQALAERIKATRLELTAPQGMTRAISTAGGVAWDAVDGELQLKALPGVFVAGEMLDWEAPTGGYLLQACFASGVWAARAILART